MAPFEGINNPWAPGGQMASKSPWAQPGREHGWGQGEDALNPPTQERLQEQENLQLAIAAAAAVAPDLVADEQRNGGGGQQVEYATEADQAPQVVDTTQSPPPQDSTILSSAPPPTEPAPDFVIARNPSPMQTMLAPLLLPNAVPHLQHAARSSEVHLNAALHRFYGDMRGVSPQAQAMRGFHFALPMLLGLAEAIGRDRGLKAELMQMASLGRSLSGAARARVAQVIGEHRVIGGGVKALENVLDLGAVTGNQRSTVSTDCVGVSFLEPSSPFAPRYYETNVLHFYYFQPSASNPMEYFGHFAIGLQSRESTEVLYFPAHGDFVCRNPDLGFDMVENPISEPETLGLYLANGRDVARFSMKIENLEIFTAIRQTILQDPKGTGNLGESLTCVGASRDILNMAFGITFRKDLNFSDPENYLKTYSEYLSYFPFVRYSDTFPREFWLAATREPNLFGLWDVSWDCVSLKQDKIFEVLYFRAK